MDPAEQRANAVAMLRRAASLPRMKDGRRPPMHGEAGGVSEGERSHSEEKREEEVRAEGKEGGEAATTEHATSEPEAAPTTEDKEPDDATDVAQEVSEPERPTSTTPAQPSKRRSRSRSRSRGSKDMRAKMRQLEIASQAEAGPDDVLSLDSPQLTSPQAYLMQLQMATAQAPPLVSPLSPFGYAAMAQSSSTSSAGAGMSAMPSLQALQNRHLQGLFRSNSAAARMMAMHKLTGEPLDFGAGPASASPALGPSPSPSPSPARARLTRNNTVAGEERVAARQQLLRRLNERIQERGDLDPASTSGPEDALSGTQTPKSKRRRSRRKSGSAVVDDREGTSTPGALALRELYPPLIALPPSRAPSVPLEQQVTPDPAPRSRTPTPLVHLHQYDSPMAHRGPVVEEEDDDPVPTPPRTSRIPLAGPSTTASASSSSGEAGARVPLVLSDPSQHSPFRQDVFPKSPFERPREEPDEEQERVLYGADAARMRAAAASELLDREISWVADPVPTLTRDMHGESDREISWNAEAVPEATRLTAIAERDVSWVEQGTLESRMPVYDEDEDEENEDGTKGSPAVNTQSTSRPQSRRPSPRVTAESQELLIDLETTPDNTPSHYSAPSQHSTTSTATMNTNARESNISDLSAISPARADTSSPLDRTHSQADSLQGWGEYPGAADASAPALTSKRSADSTGAGTSTWSKMKHTFTRSGSSLGRRSRTNSIAREKRGDTESSRESGASLISGKRESKGEGQSPAAWQQTQGHPQRAPSPTAPAAMLAPPPPRSGVSPIPPPSDTDAAKYINPKLFPFPGMVRLQEETLRSKGAGAGLSVSSPDISTQTGSGADSTGFMRSANSSMSSQQLDNVRDRKLSHQASDSRLLPKYQLMPGPGTISGAPSSGGAQIDYFNIPQPPPASNAPSTLPFTREGVKKWLNARLFPSNSQQGGHTITFSPDNKMRPETAKKPSLSDLLGRKDMGNISDWDDVDKTRAATSTSTSTVVVQSSSRDTSREGEIQESSPDDPLQAYQFANSFPHTPEVDTDGVVDAYDSHEPHELRHLSVPQSSSHDPSSATPDPASSEESPSQSSQRSESSLGSLYSPEESAEVTPQAVDILQRLDQVLHADYHNRLWSTALTTPPRRLLLSSPMLQVANCNTVKDRFLFLFSDVLVIAKPMLPDRDSLVDPQKVYPPDRKFFIKNVVHLKDIRLNIDRDEDVHAPTNALVSQRPEFIRNFVHEFAEDADSAVARLVNVHDPKGYVTLGRLLVQLPEIDRAKLGEYLSRRTSKAILKAYLDAFGFMGINIDTSLRIFLLSIHIPTGPGHANTLETLLDMFAGRWYEANAGIVAFDRDLALRLVRAIVRLNEALHAAMSHDVSSINYNRPHVTSRDFTEAFRRHDPRGLVPDSSLEKIYTSVRHEKLCQARNPTNGRAPVPISLKRPVPSRITYRRQSEPIVVRISQADPLLTIQLFGQDLTFDPPVLTFSKSSEASFRVTGTTFGPKSMVMACAGPNAPNYTGMPLSTTVDVERAFMRNTFQLAFADARGRKRKYMFSVDDPVIRHEWTGSLKRQIETARVGVGAGMGLSPEIPGTGNAQMQVYRAAELLSFSVLQDTLLAQDVGSVNGTLRRTPKQEWILPPASPAPDTAREMHIRSRSRSQIYRHGAGRHEYEPLNGNGVLPEDRPQSESELLGTLQGPSDARLWTSAELEMVCQQNSAIALVLSFLQAALPFDVDEEANALFPQFPAPPVQRNQSQSSSYQI